MEWSREWFGYDKPLRKERRGHLLQFPDHKAMKKENSSKNLRKTKEKERAKNQAVTNLTPLKNLVLAIWLLREQVWIFWLKETVSNSGILFPLLIVPIKFFIWLAGLALGRFASLYPYPGRFYFPFSYLYWLQFCSYLLTYLRFTMSEIYACLKNPRVIFDCCGCTGKLPWIGDQIFLMNTQALTPCIGFLR